MIDGRDEITSFRLEVVGRRSGKIGWTAMIERHEKRMQVGVFMEDRVRCYGRGGYEAALSETQEKFGIKSSATITKSLNYVRNYLAKSQSAPGWDHWAYVRDLYLTP